MIRDGRYYRLTNPNESNLAAWEFVSPDQKNVLLNAVIQEVHGCRDLYYVRLRGLQAQSVYADVVTGEKYSGSHRNGPVIQEKMQSFLRNSAFLYTLTENSRL